MEFTEIINQYGVFGVIVYILVKEVFPFIKEVMTNEQKNKKDLEVRIINTYEKTEQRLFEMLMEFKDVVVELNKGLTIVTQSFEKINDLNQKIIIELELVERDYEKVAMLLEKLVKENENLRK